MPGRKCNRKPSSDSLSGSQADPPEANIGISTQARNQSTTSHKIRGASSQVRTDQPISFPDREVRLLQRGW
jgi:hypothetical protein